MPRISKKSNFFRRNYFYITGSIWGIAGLLMIIFQVMDFMAYGYAIIGLTYAVFGYFKKDLPLEFIRWDQEKLEISGWQQSTRAYRWENIDGINVSETNLTIKSGVANGTMVALETYSQEDIQKLKTQLSNFKSLTLA
jgi:hypothetical protein